MMNFLIVGVGGFVGAVARYGISSYVGNRTSGVFPLGTFLVNVLGCFAIGALWMWVEERRTLSEEMQLLLGVGFLGSLTTFSTFGYESMALLKSGELRLLFSSVLLNLVIGFGAVALGRWVTKLVA